MPERRDALDALHRELAHLVRPAHRPIVGEEEPNEHRARDEEEVAPHLERVHAVHFPDAVCDRAAERASQCRARKDERDAQRALLGAVPANQHVYHPGEESGLEHLEWEAHGDEPAEVADARRT